MRNWIWLLAMLVALTFGAALSAQGVAQPKEGEAEGEGEGEAVEEADPLDNFKAMFKDVETVIGTTAVSEASIKAYLDNTKSFDEVMKGDAKWTEVKEKNLKEAFDYVSKNEKAIGWAKEKGVDLDGWLRGTLRIMVLMMRSQILEMVEAQKEMMAEQRKQLEDMKADLSDEEYKEYVKMLDEADAGLKGWKEMADGLPKGTEAEDKLIKDNAEKINAAMEDEEEEEEDGGEEDEMK